MPRDEDKPLTDNDIVPVRAFMSFDDLVQLEPRLAELEARIKAHAKANHRKDRYCANAHWLHIPDFRRGRKRSIVEPSDSKLSVWENPDWGFKRQLSALVGFDAQKKALRSSEAYDIAYEHLYELLPSCRHCSCI